MNKDALLATVIGFVVGLVITGLLLLAPKLGPYLPKLTLPSFSFGQKTTPTPTPSLTTGEFTIDSPLADAIESTAEILVSGNAEAGSTVIIQTDGDDEVVLVKEDGKYAGKITLTEGKNDLTVTSYGKSKQETKTVTVFFTQAEF
jgi:hypothetical protein